MLSVRERPQKKKQQKEKMFETAYIINKFFIFFFICYAKARNDGNEAIKYGRVESKKYKRKQREKFIF